MTGKGERGEEKRLLAIKKNEDLKLEDGRVARGVNELCLPRHTSPRYTQRQNNNRINVGLIAQRCEVYVIGPFEITARILLRREKESHVEKRKIPTPGRQKQLEQGAQIRG